MNAMKNITNSTTVKLENLQRKLQVAASLMMDEEVQSKAFGYAQAVKRELKHRDDVAYGSLRELTAMEAKLRNGLPTLTSSQPSLKVAMEAKLAKVQQEIANRKAQIEQKRKSEMASEDVLWDNRLGYI